MSVHLAVAHQRTTTFICSAHASPCPRRLQYTYYWNPCPVVYRNKVHVPLGRIITSALTTGTQAPRYSPSFPRAVCAQALPTPPTLPQANPNTGPEHIGVHIGMLPTYPMGTLSQLCSHLVCAPSQVNPTRLPHVALTRPAPWPRRRRAPPAAAPALPLAAGRRCRPPPRAAPRRCR